MSGHSKWANIKHKKAKEDSKRGRVFTKLIKEISVAVREGSGDPSSNSKLRMVLDKAKAANMPQENITRAIKKASGEAGSVSYESVIYEGYGPLGTAVIIESLTDNKKRTVADIRYVLSRHGGNLGADGSVSWMFEHKGVVRCSGPFDEDQLIEKMIDYDIDDIEFNDGAYTILSRIENLEVIKESLIKIGMNIENAHLGWIPKTPVSLSGEDEEAKVFKVLDALDDLDDVQEVYTNLG